MENTLRRNRGNRNSYSRRRAHQDVEKRISKIVLQLIISITVFSILLTLKNIDTAYTNYITTKTGTLLTYDVEFAGVYSSIGNLFSKMNISNDMIK